MARLLGLEEISTSLKHALGSVLRLCDEATVLPSASRSSETGAFKNVAMKLSGSDAGVSPDVFSPAWFSGVTLVAVPAEVAEPLLRDPGKRAAALKRLVAAIPSEMADAEVQVGPELDGDESDRDKAGWVAGFDGPSCTVGLFSARQSRAPEAGMSGMSRAHSAYFLACKAGGGTAATFHARLTSALRKGKTLDEALESGEQPGPAALRRVAAPGGAAQPRADPGDGGDGDRLPHPRHDQRQRGGAVGAGARRDPARRCARSTCCASCRSRGRRGSTARAASTRA